MLKAKFLIASLLVIQTSIFFLFSQLSPNSSLTYYGIGETDRLGFTQSAAMGGLGISLRSPNEINFNNPASYNAHDSLSFILDAGVSQSFVNATNPSTNLNFSKFNIEQVAFSFPITKWWGAAAGITPYSNVAYKIVSESIDDQSYINTTSYNGTGGINQFFIGNSMGLFSNKLNIGANINYLFGNINNTDSIITDNIYSTNQIRYRDVSVKGLSYSLGAQYIYNINNNRNILFGTTLDIPVKLNAELKDQLLGYSGDGSSSSPDTFYLNDQSSYFKTPTKIGIGASFNSDKIIFGIDYSTKLWSQAYFWDQSFNVKNSQSFNLGFQYTPDRTSFRSYLKRISYRAGIFYNDTYWNINNSEIKDYGLTIGCSFPFTETKSAFSFGLVVGKRGENKIGMLNEYYGKVMLSFKFSEMWFYKPRYN